MNLQAEPIRITYKELKELNDISLKRKCPSCSGGVLPLRRNWEGGLLNTDQCLQCGQRFIYTDITPGTLIP